MASTKVAAAMWNGVTLVAGTPATATAVNLTDGFGASIGMKITNGAVGPTAPAQIQPQISQDNSEWYDFGDPLIGRTKGAAVVSGKVVIPDSVQYARLVASGNNVAVVIDADISEVTALA